MTALMEIDAPPELKTETADCVKWSNANQITTPERFAETGEHLKKIKNALRVADEFFDPLVKQAFDLHKLAVARKKSITDPLKQSETLDKAKMLNYTQEQQRKAEDERRRLQAIADEAARREREALEKRAAAAKKPETQERLREQAEAVVAPVVAVAPTVTPKAAGVSVRKTWKAEIVDMVAFLKFACESVRTDLILPNYSVLEALAKGLKEAASMPGVKFFEQSTMSARG